MEQIVLHALLYCTVLYSAVQKSKVKYCTYRFVKKVHGYAADKVEESDREHLDQYNHYFLKYTRSKSFDIATF